MEQFRGTISKDGITVLEDVPVYFEIVSSGRLKECRGQIVTEVGWQVLEPNVRYTLTAHDGRSGDFFFAGIVPYGDGQLKRIDITFCEGFE